jgi:hypothetical protein
MSARVQSAQRADPRPLYLQKGLLADLPATVHIPRAQKGGVSPMRRSGSTSSDGSEPASSERRRSSNLGAVFAGIDNIFIPTPTNKAKKEADLYQLGAFDWIRLNLSNYDQTRRYEQR